MAILGVVGVAGVHYTYYYAISKTNVATAILLQYLAPAFILLFAVLAQGETFSFSETLFIRAGVCRLLFYGGRLQYPSVRGQSGRRDGGTGVCHFFAFYSVYGEYGLRRYSVWTILVYGLAAAALFWWCVHPPWMIAAAGYSIRTWGLFGFLGLFSAIVPFGLYSPEYAILKPPAPVLPP